MFCAIAFETTEPSGSIALVRDGEVIAERTLSSGQRTAQALLPAARELLTSVGWTPANVKLVAVTIGPGSFTGLRIGVTAAKTWAYAVGAHVMGVNTLEAVAQRALPHLRRQEASVALSVALDAERQQVFAGRLMLRDGQYFDLLAPVQILGRDTWLDSLPVGDVVSGPALRQLADRLPRHVTPLPREAWAPTAGAVGLVAWRRFQAGRRDDFWRLVPDYGRRSAAEEKSGK